MKFASALLVSAAFSLATLAPTLAEVAPADAALEALARAEIARTLPEISPGQADAIIDCTMTVLAALTPKERQAIVDGPNALEVIGGLAATYPGLTGRLDLCDNAVLAGVDLATGPGRDALDVVIDVAVYDRIPAKKPDVRADAIACLAEAFRPLTREHRDLVAADGLTTSEATRLTIEAAYPGFADKIQACNRFLSA